MNKKTFLIAGSTGFLGSKVLNFLSKEDTKIYCLSRRKNMFNHKNIEVSYNFIKTIYEKNFSIEKFKKFKISENYEINV